MIRRIEIKDPAVREQLVKDSKVTSAAVSYALNFKRNSPKSHEIREMALQRGGIYLEEQEVCRLVKVLDAKGNVVRTI